MIDTFIWLMATKRWFAWAVVGGLIVNGVLAALNLIARICAAFAQS